MKPIEVFVSCLTQFHTGGDPPVYPPEESRPNNDLRAPFAHDPRQTFLPQQVLVAQTSPGRHSKLEVQPARGPQRILGPQNPVLLESSKQKQFEPQLLRLPHDDPLQVGAEHWPFWQTPEGHTLPHVPQLLGSLRTSWHGAPLQLRVPAAHVGLGAGIAVITGVAPTHEQALE